MVGEGVGAAVVSAFAVVLQVGEPHGAKHHSAGVLVGAVLLLPALYQCDDVLIAVLEEVLGWFPGHGPVAVARRCAHSFSVIPGGGISCHELWSGRLWAPAHLAFAPGQPMPALFREVFPLAELLGLQLAAEQGSAMGVGSVGEVLAGDADPS